MTCFRYHSSDSDSGWGFVPGDSDTPILVMDSFLVEDGAVAGLELHRHRFSDSVRALTGRTVPAELYDAVAAHLPQRGRYFPRVEYRKPDYYLRIRPAPQLRTDTILWVPPIRDPRRHPSHKGPDHEVLAELRDQARAHGADDAVLHDGIHVLEAANAAIIVEKDGQLIQPAGPVLPSVTVQLLDETVRRQPVRLEDVDKYPAWTLSALHGRTPVRRWMR